MAPAERSSPTAVNNLPESNGIVITTTAYPNMIVRGRLASAPRPTRAAEQSATIPSATAVGGIAAFSADVRLMGAGSHRVSAISDTPSTAVTSTYARAPVALPLEAKLRAAARANAGMIGSTYCGSFDWLRERKSSGTITQQARSSASRAGGRSEEHTSELQSRRDLVC